MKSTNKLQVILLIFHSSQFMWQQDSRHILYNKLLTKYNNGAIATKKTWLGTENRTDTVYATAQAIKIAAFIFFSLTSITESTTIYLLIHVGLYA